MSNNVFSVSLMDLWRLVDATFELMHPEVHRHHQMVGYLAYRLGRELGLPVPVLHLLFQAAYVHDMGGAVDGEGISLSDIESANRQIAVVSANILSDFPAFSALSEIVRHSQTPYRETRQLTLPELTVPMPDRSELPEELSGIIDKMPQIRLRDPMLLSNLVHLADAVSLKVKPEIPVLNQVNGIVTAVRAGEGDVYAPQVVRALEAIAGDERVWLELAYSPGQILYELLTDRPVHLDVTKQVAKLIGMIIDFRSPFTAMHSAGVAASARALARLAGMDDQECCMIEIAGSLHDLGKIRTPAQILEKPGKLTEAEFNAMKEHAFFTDLLLSRVRGFETLGKWASLHHEKLNGRGYPYQLRAGEIPLGAQVMAVADVFSAITEDRPYRKGMPVERVRAILQQNAERGELSPLLTELLIANFDAVNAERDRASREAGKRYYRVMKD